MRWWRLALVFASAGLIGASLAGLYLRGKYMRLNHNLPGGFVHTFGEDFDVLFFQLLLVSMALFAIALVDLIAFTVTIWKRVGANSRGATK